MKRTLRLAINSGEKSIERKLPIHEWMYAGYTFLLRDCSAFAFCHRQLLCGRAKRDIVPFEPRNC